MNTINITVSRINLGGIGFVTDAELPCKDREECTLNLKANDTIDVDVKIIVIQSDKDDSGYTHRAMYRHLTDEQIASLQELMSVNIDDICGTFII